MTRRAAEVASEHGIGQGPVIPPLPSGVPHWLPTFSDRWLQQSTAQLSPMSQETFPSPSIASVSLRHIVCLLPPEILANLQSAVLLPTYRKQYRVLATVRADMHYDSVTLWQLLGRTL